MDAIQATLNPWLGKPRWKQTQGRVTFRYSFDSGGAPPMKLRLKIEINTREHMAVLGYTERPFAVRSRWFEGTANVRTFELDELLGTKLRALFQRKRRATCLTSSWACRTDEAIQSASSTRSGLIWRRRTVQSPGRRSRGIWTERSETQVSDPTLVVFLRPGASGMSLRRRRRLTRCC